LCGDWLVPAVFVTRAGKPLHRFCKPVIEKEWRGGRIKLHDAMKEGMNMVLESSVADSPA